MSNSHRMRYKNEGVDSKELRRRREEEGIQLRKQKRDIQLFKRRNINETIQTDDVDVSVDTSVKSYIHHFSRPCYVLANMSHRTNESPLFKYTFFSICIIRFFFNILGSCIFVFETILNF